MPSVSRSDFNRLLSLKAIDPNGAVRFEIRHNNVSYFPGGEAFVVAGETTAQATLKLETPALAVTPKPLPVPEPAPASKVEPVEAKPAPKVEEEPEPKPKTEHKPARHPRKEVNRGDS